ncbi:type VI secretion protein [Pseudomonas cichorii]|nr:type VI secretion protein [Pseudomonas cichorii]
MSIRCWLSVIFILAVIAVLPGCSGSFKFDDDDYRSLGDPGAINRGK